MKLRTLSFGVMAAGVLTATAILCAPEPTARTRTSRDGVTYVEYVNCRGRLSGPQEIWAEGRLVQIRQFDNGDLVSWVEYHEDGTVRSFTVDEKGGAE